MITVLSINDVPIYNELIKETLKEKYRTVLAATCDEALEILRTDTIDCIIADYYLDGETSEKVFSHTDLPVIIHTGMSSSDNLIQQYREIKNIIDIMPVSKNPYKIRKRLDLFFKRRNPYGLYSKESNEKTKESTELDVNTE